jgi:hypothetical protein
VFSRVKHTSLLCQVRYQDFTRVDPTKRHKLRTLSCIYIGDVKHDAASEIAGIIVLYLLTLANRNHPICVALPKVDKGSTVADCRVLLSPTVSLTNVANVNDPLKFYKIVLKGNSCQ